MINIYIHPGFPKTGTTFLQKKIFSQIKNFIFIKKPRSMVYNTNELYDKLFKSNFYNSEQKDTYNLFLYRDQFVNQILKKLKKKTKKNILLSDEGLLDPFGSPGSINIYLLKDVIDKLVEKTKLKVKVKFIITIRNYEEIIFSYFAYRNHFFSKDINYYLKKKSFLNNFNYFKFYQEIRSIFNSEVLFLDLDLLISNPNKYIDKIEKFMNIKIKKKINFKEKQNKNSLLNGDYKIFYIKKKLFPKNLLFTFFNVIIYIIDKFQYKTKIIITNEQKKFIKNYFKYYDKKLKKII